MQQTFSSGKELIGRTFEHKWTEGKHNGVIYHVKFKSPSELFWTGIEGFPKGRSDTQNYALTKISDNIFQFSWLANDGLSVSITYNFNEMRAFGVVSNNEEQNVLSGLLKIIG